MKAVCELQKISSQHVVRSESYGHVNCDYHDVQSLLLVYNSVCHMYS